MTPSADVGMTLNYVLDSSCEKFGEQPAIGMAMEKPLTYNELHERVITLAHCLQQSGIRKDSRVALLAENSHFWAMAYFAVIRLGAVAVPILPDLPEADVHHILTEMKVEIVFTSQRQIEKLYELNQKFLKQVVTLDDTPGVADLMNVTALSEYMTGQGEDDQKKEPFAEVQEDDLASILYTSGTSGYSKAVMLSHKNLTSNAYSAASMIKIEPGSAFLSILPVSHAYEFTLGLVLPLLKGARVAYAGRTPTPAILQKLCQHERPYGMFAVPLVMEKIYKKRVLPNINASRPLSLVCKFSLGRKLIYKKIGAKLLDFFGGNLQLLGIGGAALNPEVEQFLLDAGLPYLVGYGLSESAPLLSGGPPGDKTIAVGSAGKPLPGVEIRIDNPDPETGVGEIMGRGPNVMHGYFNDPESTAKTLSEDGWLATGDLGIVDEAGNLHVRGRSKNVIVMANGENVYPEPIEHKMNAYSWVVEVLVVENNGRLDAWIYPDYEVIDEQTAGKTSRERQAHIAELLESMRVEVNSKVSTSSRVARISERREPFIKTATHKIKRYLYDGGAMVS
ncbi:AMP-binding protein [Methanococcoides sp. SA1]|uniref:AMP-binding protein n=1 Tax=Candidatus Desulfatifera sulfidica TaxID=2841691 RepID=A0A8J6T9F6_9BACT|nr:AMP-binding protein [Candidatus Desulfatifera sulfidica]NPE28518.1 AMP-binding protein [Methanococcoides sp. SA1]